MLYACMLMKDVEYSMSSSYIFAALLIVLTCSFYLLHICCSFYLLYICCSFYLLCSRAPSAYVVMYSLYSTIVDEYFYSCIHDPYTSVYVIFLHRFLSHILTQVLISYSYSSSSSCIHDPYTSVYVIFLHRFLSRILTHVSIPYSYSSSNSCIHDPYTSFYLIF
jgi:hypothetical protein